MNSTIQKTPVKREKVLNATPDSFYPEYSKKHLLKAEKIRAICLEEGADFLRG